MIYANNAATTWPKPESVYRAMDAALRRAGASGRSSTKEAPWGIDPHAAQREEIARFLGVGDASRLLFTPGCTWALNQAILGLPWRAGDVALMSGVEHHAVSRPVRKAARDHEIRLEISPYRPGRPFDLDWLERRLKSGGVRLVATTMASNVTGEILPFREIAALARRHGAWSLLDGAQAAGLLPFGVDELGCDLFATAGHKGLLGPPGIGLLFVAPGTPLSLWAQGGTGRDSGKHAPPETYPHAGEVGTQNTPAIEGLAAGVRWVREQGVETLQAKERALRLRFLAGLAGIPRAKPLGGIDAPATSALSLRFDGITPRALSAWLAETHDITTRAGYHCSPLAHETLGTLPGDGAIRFSFGCFNTADEVDRVLDALRAAP